LTNSGSSFTVLGGRLKEERPVPIYEYECESCHHRVELIQRFSDKPLKKCAKCGGPLHKVLSPPALVFKGTGWYVTDYARAGQNGGNGKAESRKSDAATDTGGKSDAAKSDAKKD
jgi:putative FmdB family regulatory protein